MQPSVRRFLIPTAVAGVVVVVLGVALLSQQGSAPACGAYTVKAGSPVTLDSGVKLTLTGDAKELRFDSVMLAEADLSAEANALVLAAVNAMPMTLHTVGSMITFERCGDESAPVTLDVIAPDPSLDAYAWDGTQWNWLGGSTQIVVASLPNLPQIVAWVESLPNAPIIGTEPDPATGGLAPEYRGIITELYAPGLTVTANGTLSGQVPAVPEAGAPYVVYPVISNLKTDGKVDVESVEAMLRDEAARKANVDALVKLATGANFAGVAIDYRGLASQWDDPRAELIEDLAAALHAKGRQLVVGPTWPGPEPDLGTGAYYARIGQAVDVLLVDLGFQATGYGPDGMVVGGLKWITQRVNRSKVQPIIRAASLGSATGEEATISFERAISSLVIGTQNPISATTAVSLTFRLNPSSTVSFDSAMGSYSYLAASNSDQSIYTAGTLAVKLNALSSLRLRGVVIRDVQGSDVAPNLLEPIKAYRQQSAVTGSSELNVNWSIAASDGSRVVSETRPLVASDLKWVPDRDGTFDVSATINAVKLTVAQVIVGEDGRTPDIDSGTPITDTSESCLNASYVADATIPDNTRFDKGKDFTKTWRVRNSGTCDWSADTVLAFVSGSQLGADSPVEVGALDAGKTIEISVPMTASDKDGTYTGMWQLRNKDGAYGDQLSVVIKVGAEVVATPPPGPVVPPVAGGRAEYGIHAHFYGYIDADAGAQGIAAYTNELGLGWVKIQFRWGDYDYYCNGPDLNVLNTMINRANEAGLKVLLSIVTSPPCTHNWMGGDVHGPPDDAQALADLAGGLTDLFKGRIHAIEVWNEPNIVSEWRTNPQTIDAKRYTQMLALAYNAIKSKDPNVLVISAALAPTGWNDGVNAVDDFVYLRQMVDAGAAKYMDCVGTHVNALRVPPSAAQGGEYDSLFNPTHHSWYFKDTVQGYQSITGKPACVTEFGVASSETIGIVEGFEWATENTQQEQADWVTEGMGLCKQWGCRLMILWNLDYGPVIRQVDANALYSFIDIGMGRRPVFAAVKNWCAANGCK